MIELKILKAIKSFLRTGSIKLSRYKIGLDKIMDKFITKNYLNVLQKRIDQTEKKLKKNPKLESEIIELDERMEGFSNLLKEDWDYITQGVVMRTVKKSGQPIDEEDVMQDMAHYLLSEGLDVIKKNIKPNKSEPVEVIKLFRRVIEIASLREVDQYRRQQRIVEKEDTRRDQTEIDPSNRVEFQDLLSTIINRLKSFIRTHGDRKHKDLFPAFFEVLIDTVRGGGDIKKAFTNAYDVLKDEYGKSKIWFYKRWEDFRNVLLEFFIKEEKTTDIPAETVKNILKLSAADRIWHDFSRIFIARWVLGKSIREEISSNDFISPEDMVTILRNKKNKKAYVDIIKRLVKE